MRSSGLAVRAQARLAGLAAAACCRRVALLVRRADDGGATGPGPERAARPSVCASSAVCLLLRVAL